MERLNPLDALFVDAEDQERHTSMAIASIAVFEGPAPSYEEFCQAVSGRLALVPMYRRKLRAVPWRLGRPVWVFGLTRGDFIGQVKDIITVGEFYDLAAGGQIIFT